MSFVERAFTPPGSTPPPLGSPQNPIPAGQPGSLFTPPAPATPAPTPPTAPTAPAPPPQFGPTPTQQAQAKQRAAVSATTMLGAAAAGGQTARKTLLGQ